MSIKQTSNFHSKGTLMIIRKTIFSFLAVMLLFCNNICKSSEITINCHKATHEQLKTWLINATDEQYYYEAVCEKYFDEDEEIMKHQIIEIADLYITRDEQETTYFLNARRKEDDDEHEVEHEVEEDDETQDDDEDEDKGKEDKEQDKNEDEIEVIEVREIYTCDNLTRLCIIVDPASLAPIKKQTVTLISPLVTCGVFNTL